MAEGNTPCEDLGFFNCTDEDTRWQFYENGDGTWTIKGRFQNDSGSVLRTVDNASCGSYPDNPHKRAAW